MLIHLRNENQTNSITIVCHWDDVCWLTMVNQSTFLMVNDDLLTNVIHKFFSFINVIHIQNITFTLVKFHLHIKRFICSFVRVCVFELSFHWLLSHSIFQLYRCCLFIDVWNRFFQLQMCISNAIFKHYNLLKFHWLNATGAH